MLNAYELTKRGVGITIYPAAAADLAEHSGICIRKITEPKVMASYVLIRNRSRALSRVAQEFFNYVVTVQNQAKFHKTGRKCLHF